MENREILFQQETERRRIAEELHDTTVQEMIHLSHQLELALLYMDKDVIQSKLEIVSARKQIKGIINGIRETIYDLHPMTLDDIGWDAAFSRLKDDLQNKSGNLGIHFDIDPVDMSDGVTALSIYRIINEACRNIVRHSKAENIWIDVKCLDPMISVCIKDDGIGFSQQALTNHFGLQFMQERVALLSGEMDIESDSDGTRIRVVIPCKL